jgi:hypothetical protein
MSDSVVWARIYGTWICTSSICTPVDTGVPRLRRIGTDTTAVEPAVREVAELRHRNVMRFLRAIDDENADRGSNAGGRSRRDGVTSVVRTGVSSARPTIRSM